MPQPRGPSSMISLVGYKSTELRENSRIAEEKTGWENYKDGGSGADGLILCGLKPAAKEEQSVAIEILPISSQTKFGLLSFCFNHAGRSVSGAQFLVSIR